MSRQPRRRPKAMAGSAGEPPEPIPRAKAIAVAAPGSHSADAHTRRESPLPTGVSGSPPSSKEFPSANPLPAMGEDFTTLRIWAESFYDIQEARKAIVNRMERGGVDADLLVGQRQMLEAAEHSLKLAMVRAYRRVVRTYLPQVEEWQQAHFGIGEHLMARLLGHLGHPIIAEPYTWTDDAPEGHECDSDRCGKRHLVALQPFRRTLRQLWAYCGHGAPGKRRKGMSQEEAFALGHPTCKMLVHLLAEATIKSGPAPMPPPNAIRPPARDRLHYRRIYDERKASTEERGWTDGHRHADALRIVGKEILRDLWTVAGATHQGNDNLHDLVGRPVAFTEEAS